MDDRIKITAVRVVKDNGNYVLMYDCGVGSDGSICCKNIGDDVVEHLRKFQTTPGFEPPMPLFFHGVDVYIINEARELSEYDIRA